MGIQSVVDKNIEKTSDGLNDAGCTACEMAVVWIKNQLRLNETVDQILDFVNAVNNHSYSCFQKLTSFMEANMVNCICSYVIGYPVQMENQ